MSQPEQLSCVEMLALADHHMEAKEFRQAATYYRIAANYATTIVNRCFQQADLAHSMQRDADKQLLGDKGKAE